MTPNPDDNDCAEVRRIVGAPPSAVWAVLADGWFYATWVVGASRVRAVDATWPAEGSRIHHSFGVWPAVVDDTTSVVEARPEQLLVLQARGWPLGEGRARLTLSPVGVATEVVLVEDATHGPGRFVPSAVRQAVIHPRNVEALRRLALLVEGRHGAARTG